MYFFNNEHQTLIKSYLRPITENPIDNELIDHKRYVDYMTYFESNGLKINISRQMLIDLYNQMQDIESEIVQDFHQTPF
jgi:hypothetical protein